MACSNLEPQKENSVLISTGKFNYKINFGMVLVNVKEPKQ